MSNAEHTRSLDSSVFTPGHPSLGAGRTSDITETRTTAPSTRSGHIGLIVVGSLATGLIAALLLVVVVFAGAAEPVVTGSAMLAFGLGCAMLAALSVWRTDQPQRWALENGFGEDTPSWAWIVKDIAPDTQVCVYDRAGQGWSDSAAGPQDGVQLAADLHTLLERATVPGPYVLAGHSVGGTYALTFAARYPQQVAGMVLLDSSTPRQFTALPDYPAAYSSGRRMFALLPPLARVGLWRLVAAGAFAGLPPQARSQELALAATTRELSSQRVEWSELPAAFTQAQALTDLNGKPLIVVTAGFGQQAGWSAAQDQLARLSTNSSQRTVPGADHTAPLYNQAMSANSSQAIRDVLSAIRTGTPLKA